jgi:hypothetical protein
MLHRVSPERGDESIADVRALPSTDANKGLALISNANVDFDDESLG